MNLNARNQQQKSRPYQSLADILANDNNGLLANIIARPTLSIDDNLVSQFQEINEFVKQHGHSPSEQNPKSNGFEEKKLARRLASLKQDTEKVHILKPYDNFGLLTELKPNPNAEPLKQTQVKQTPTSIEDILRMDSQGLLAQLGDIDSSLLAKTYNRSILDRASPDQFSDELVAKRKICEDFDKFSPIFTLIHESMRTKQYHKTAFSSVKDIREGSVFVLNGLVCYVASIYQSETRKNERNQQRLRLIFANGTESNMLIRSLASAQYRHDADSYQVVITAPEWQNLDLLSGFADTPTHDMANLQNQNGRKLTGIVYVAKLKKPRIELAKYSNLHKIGFSKNRGELRAKSSQMDATFLFSEVDIIAEWALYDSNPQQVEYRLHQFFHNQRLNMTLKVGSQEYKPNEWFDVDIVNIEKALQLIFQGKINQYQFDSASKTVLPFVNT
mgnify:FL=1|jgi:hypothetical protein